LPGVLESAAIAFTDTSSEDFDKVVTEMDGMTMQKTLRFVDLFAGIGGIRKGFELAAKKKGLKTMCVFTSEIKPAAVNVLKQNHPRETITGDITVVDETKIPDFDYLLAGFPCQAFSAAGKRLGFSDTRGTLFFDVERILKAKRPKGFILENVEGLVNHDRQDPKAPYGRTLTVILEHLTALGYKTTWRVLNATEFGVPQERKRIYIVGSLQEEVNLEGFKPKHRTLGDILQTGLPTKSSKFIDTLLKHYSVDELYGKAIKDKRGGAENIHSWDLEIKGKVSRAQKELLNVMLKERRKKKWADIYGIDWMDGMPLTLEFIESFHKATNLKKMLDDLVAKKYVVLEHPKKRLPNGQRIQDEALPVGYNIVTGKMSFEVNKVLSPSGVAPTLVAMDMKGLFVVDGKGIRNLSLREGLRLFGYPDSFKFDIPEAEGFDLLGNTVVVPVIQAVATRVLDVTEEQDDQ